MTTWLIRVCALGALALTSVAAAAAHRANSRHLWPAALAHHRARGQSVLGGRRRPRRPLHVLRRRGVGRHLEDHRRRRELDADLRRAAGAVDRLAGRRAVGPERRVGGHRRGQDPQPHLGRPGRLQLARRRARPGRCMGLEQTGRIPRLVVHPEGSERRAGLRARPRLRAAARARRLPHDRRRRRPGPRRCSSTRTPAARTSRWIRRTRACCSPACGSSRSTPGAATSGGPGSGLFTSARRRRDLDAAARAAACRPSPVGKVAVAIARVEPEPRLRADRDRRRRAVEGPADRARPAVALGGRRRQLAGGELRPQRDGPRALLLAHGRRARRRGRGVLPDRVVLEVDRRRPHHRPCCSAPRRPGGDHHDIWIDPDQRQPPDRRARPGPVDHASIAARRGTASG